jgi:hypothetical protein
MLVNIVETIFHRIFEYCHTLLGCKPLFSVDNANDCIMSKDCLLFKDRDIAILCCYLRLKARHRDDIKPLTKLVF